MHASQRFSLRITYYVNVQCNVHENKETSSDEENVTITGFLNGSRTCRRSTWQ